MSIYTEIKAVFNDLKKYDFTLPTVTKGTGTYKVIINHENSECDLYDYSNYSIGPDYMKKIDAIAKKYGMEVEHENNCIVGIY